MAKEQPEDTPPFTPEQLTWIDRVVAARQDATASDTLSRQAAGGC